MIAPSQISKKKHSQHTYNTYTKSIVAIYNELWLSYLDRSSIIREHFVASIILNVSKQCSCSQHEHPVFCFIHDAAIHLFSKWIVFFFLTPNKYYRRWNDRVLSVLALMLPHTQYSPRYFSSVVINVLSALIIA